MSKSTSNKSTKKTTPRYRAEALAELHSPEQLDNLIQVVPRRAWVWLAGIYILIISLIIWGIFGSIPTRVMGTGVLLVENGLVYNADTPEAGGQVTQIMVAQGSTVKKGDVIAKLERPDLAKKIELENNYLDQLKNEQTELKRTAEKELTDRAKSFTEQMQKLNNSLDSESTNLADIQKVLSLKEEYFKKGYVVLQDIESTRRDFYATQDRVEQLKVQLEQLKNTEDDFKEQWRKQLKDKDLSVLAEQLKLDNLQAELNIVKVVTSPVDGIVISINTSLGSIVSAGATIATITSFGEGLDALIFMLPHEGEKVKSGMKAIVTPTTIERAEYGGMEGFVTAVSTFPQESNTIIALLHNSDLAKEYVKSGAPTGIRIRITRANDTFSGYKWTTSKGPDQKIIPGTVTDANVTVRQQPPFSLIIPAFKKLLGVS